EPRDRVLVVRNDRVLAQLAQRHLRQHELGGDALGRRRGGDARELVPRLLLVGLGEHLLQIREAERGAAQGRRELHRATILIGPRTYHESAIVEPCSGTRFGSASASSPCASSSASSPSASSRSCSSSRAATCPRSSTTRASRSAMARAFRGKLARTWPRSRARRSSCSAAPPSRSPRSRSITAKRSSPRSASASGYRRNDGAAPLRLPVLRVHAAHL